MSSDNLQLEGGDFIIRFGPSMTFVLHREVLMAKSPHFHALLSDHWHIATRVEKQDNEEIAIGEDDLYFDTEAGIVELCQLVWRTYPEARNY